MTKYHPHKVQLSDNQKKNLLDAVVKKDGVTIRLKHEDLSGGDTLHLTQTQINKLKRAATAKKGAELKMSKTQLSHTARFIKEEAQGATQTPKRTARRPASSAKKNGVAQTVKKKIQPTAQAGEGLQIGKKAGWGLHINPAGFRPPPFYGSWGEKK